jgi:L-alanine-DL-glutamate epimerase-like enolase superfamily enzyme
VASYLTDHVIPCLIGRDARQIEDIWQYLYKGAYWRRGPITMAAIAAVDTALWDIKGKALNTPVYNLLGGRSREAVMVYGHANGRDIEDTVKAVGRYAAMGYKASPSAERHSGALGHVRRRQGPDAIRAGGEGPAVRVGVEHGEVPQFRADAVQAASRGVRRRRAPAARRAPPVHAD